MSTKKLRPAGAVGNNKTGRFAMVPENLLDAPVSDRAIRLWAILARYAGSAGECWPARSTLAKRLRCSVPSIDRAVAELVVGNWLQKTTRKRGGACDTTLYRINLSHEGGGLTGDEGVASPVIGGSLTGDEGVASPVIERTRATETRATERDNTVGFDEFYSTYPRKVAKQAALKAWEKLNADQRSRATRAATAYKTATSRWPENDRRYIPHPSTWLNQGRYDDDPKEWQRKADRSSNPDREVSPEYRTDPQETADHWKATGFFRT